MSYRTRTTYGLSLGNRSVIQMWNRRLVTHTEHNEFQYKCTGTQEWTDRNFSLGNTCRSDIHQHTTYESSTNYVPVLVTVGQCVCSSCHHQMAKLVDHRTPLDPRATRAVLRVQGAISRISPRVSPILRLRIFGIFAWHEHNSA